MKKTFLLIMCGVLALTLLTGCGNNETKGNLDDSKSSKEDNKKNEEQVKEKIGKLVNYTPNNGDTVKWEIFYEDNENIYLIAADFIDASRVPQIENSMSVLANKHSLWFDKEINNIYKDGLNSKMNENVKKWINYDLSTIYSYKRAITAYLLDTERWNTEYGNSEYSEYVIGAPTLELYTTSWNAKGYKKLYYDNFEKTEGYFIGTTSKPSTYFVDMSSTDGINDSLYYPDTTNYNEIHGYWLAAPSANSGVGLMSVKDNGMIEDSRYDGNGKGIRPVICLKSNVSLVESKTEEYDYDLKK